MTVFDLIGWKTLDDAFQADDVLVFELQQLFQIGERG